MQRDLHQLKKEWGNFNHRGLVKFLHITFGTEMGPEPGSPVSQGPDFRVTCFRDSWDGEHARMFHLKKKSEIFVRAK